MTTEVQTQTLRERIEEARTTYERERQESEAREAKQNRERLQAQLSRWLKIDVDESAMTMRNAETPVVEIEGYRFSLDFEGDLAQLRHCDTCGEDAYRVVRGVGSLVNDEMNYPHRDGSCKEQKQAVASQATEARLLQALRDFIAENSVQG